MSASRLAVPIPATPPVSQRGWSSAPVGNDGEGGSVILGSLPAVAEPDDHIVLDDRP
jgi:hypothetical protein